MSKVNRCASFSDHIVCVAPRKGGGLGVARSTVGCQSKAARPIAGSQHVLLDHALDSSRLALGRTLATASIGAQRCAATNNRHCRHRMGLARD